MLCASCAITSCRLKQAGETFGPSSYDLAPKPVRTTQDQTRPESFASRILPSERLAYECAGVLRANTLRTSRESKYNFMGTFLFNYEQDRPSPGTRHLSKHSMLATGLARGSSGPITSQVTIQARLQSICSAKSPGPGETVLHFVASQSEAYHKFVMFFVGSLRLFRGRGRE